MNERERVRSVIHRVKVKWSTLSRGRERYIYRWWVKVTVLGTGWAGRPENVRRPEAQIGPDVRQSSDDRPL